MAARTALSDMGRLLVRAPGKTCVPLTHKEGMGFTQRRPSGQYSVVPAESV